MTNFGIGRGNEFDKVKHMKDIGNRLAYPYYEVWKRADGHHHVNMKPISEVEKFIRNERYKCV